MSATIDGVPWSAVCVPYAINNPAAGSLYITGLDQPLDSGRAQDIALSVGVPQQPPTPTRPLTTGTYQIGGAPLTYGGDNYAIVGIFCTPGQTTVTASACSTWEAGPNLGSGSVTIVTLTSTSASGTFSLSLVGILGTTGGKVITNGAFNVTF